MFSAPEVIQTEVFTRLPDSFRDHKGRRSEWYENQPGNLQRHSLLEGPAFDTLGNLYCVDTPWGRIFRIDPAGRWELIIEYDGEPNGLKIHQDGRIYVADYKNGIMALDPKKGRIEPILQRVRLEHLKAVNDLVFASNGDLYFTDQGLTGLQDPTGRVFRLRPDGQVQCLLDNVPSPNGLVLNADETALYVAVTRANSIWRVPLMSNGVVSKVGAYINLSGGSGPDGLALDDAGNLAVAHVGLGAIWLFSAVGEPLARIQSNVGRHTTNIAYGGPDRKTLYITESESGSILQAKMSTPGKKMFSGV